MPINTAVVTARGRLTPHYETRRPSKQSSCGTSASTSISRAPAEMLLSIRSATAASGEYPNALRDSTSASGLGSVMSQSMKLPTPSSANRTCTGSRPSAPDRASPPPSNFSDHSYSSRRNSNVASFLSSAHVAPQQTAARLRRPTPSIAPAPSFGVYSLRYGDELLDVLRGGMCRPELGTVVRAQGRSTRQCGARCS